jgi:hypothetical protein
VIKVCLVSTFIQVIWQFKLKMKDADFIETLKSKSKLIKEREGNRRGGCTFQEHDKKRIPFFFFISLQDVYNVIIK